MEQSLFRSFARMGVNVLWLCVLVVSVVSLLAVFGDHYRGHAPPGAVLLSLVVLFIMLVVVHALYAFADTTSIRTAATQATLDTIVTYSASLLVFGSLHLLGTWFANGGWESVQKDLLYFIPGLFGSVFWLLARK